MSSLPLPPTPWCLGAAYVPNTYRGANNPDTHVKKGNNCVAMAMLNM